MWVAHVQCWNCRSKLFCFDINFKKSVNDEHERSVPSISISSILVVQTRGTSILGTGTVYLHLARKKI